MTRHLTGCTPTHGHAPDRSNPKSPAANPRVAAVTEYGEASALADVRLGQWVSVARSAQLQQSRHRNRN